MNNATTSRKTCIVVDDEPNAREVLKRYIGKVGWLDFRGEFKDPFQALSFLQVNTIDVVFLDINMPDLSGMQLVKSLGKLPAIIFTTAYSEYAVEGFEISAIDYLLKPIRLERFLQAVNKLSWEGKGLDTPRDYVMVKSGHELHKISLDEILFLQKDSNYIEIHTVSGTKTLIRENMNNLFNVFPESQFIRTHKSFAVSRLHVKVIEAHQITMSNGDKIPLGAIYRSSVIGEFPYLK